jgi:hypothetical protein
MLKIRKDVPPPPPKPFSDEAVDLLFFRLREKFGIQPSIDPAKWVDMSKKAGAVPVEF